MQRAGGGPPFLHAVNFQVNMGSPIQQANAGERPTWKKGIGRFSYEFFAAFWWGAGTLWWLLWWSPSVRVFSLVLWLVSLIFVLVQKSAGALFLFELASGVTIVLWSVPFFWGTYRLYTIVRSPIRAGWCRADAALCKELRSDWMQQVKDLGFKLAGYLTKDCDDAPHLALFVNSENRDSAHISQIAGKELLVFKTRFEDGFAFETGNTDSVRLLPMNPNFPTFRFPQLRLTSDLYLVHERLKSCVGSGREPVISNGEGEIAEFISRAEVVRKHMMSRDYRATTAGVYRFSIQGALRHAASLTWPAKPIREVISRRRALNQLTRLGFEIDKKTGRIVGR